MPDFENVNYLNFVEKPFKISYALTGNLSSWNEPVGIATREAIINMIEGLEDDGWHQEYECKPTEELKTDDNTNT